MYRRCAMLCFSFQFFQPSQFDSELIDGQSEHPHCFVKVVSDLFSYIVQGCELPLEFRFEKFAPTRNLLAEGLRVRLPGEGKPSEKWRPLPLCRPTHSGERFLQCLLALGGCSKYLALGTCGGFIVAGAADHSQARELLERVIDLRPRDGDPIAPLPPLQLVVRLVAVHRGFEQQAEQNQIWRSQLRPLTPGHVPPSACVCGSNTTIGIGRAEAVDRAPAPPQPRRCRARMGPGTRR